MSLHTDTRALELARRRGYLRVGARPSDRLLEEEWASWCRAQGVDLLVARRQGGSLLLEVEVSPLRPLSPVGQQELHALARRAGGTSTGGTARLPGLPPSDLAAWVRQVREVLARDRTVERGLRLQDLQPRFQEGRATCVDNTGYEDVLEVGDRVYLREIPNAPGRCLVVGHLDRPLLGVPLHRFRMLGPGEEA